MENVEIERKFLVCSDEWRALATQSFAIRQGYLSLDPERTVRVRLKGNKGYLTIKGASDESGWSRFEWEKEISADEAEQLLALSLQGKIEKTRYIVPLSGQEPLVVEVDVFEGEHKGLILAEIELPSRDMKIELPEWLGKEVTGDIHYYNAYLAKQTK